MNTKQILSLAILATLPFTAHATDPVGPAAGPANGTPVIATASAPYVTQTPTADDATHIASTAYVKGAYNDAIAAVNKVDADKQDQLMNMESTPNPISNNVASSNSLGTSMEIVGSEIVRQGMVGENASNEITHMKQWMESKLGADLDTILPTLETVNELLRGAGDKIGKKRVEIYTTWENDNAKQQVAFVDAR